MLDGLKLRTATLGNIEIENDRPEIGVNCILVSRSPEPKAPLRLSDDPIYTLALKLITVAVADNLLFMTRVARHPDEQLPKLACEEVFTFLEFPTNFLGCWCSKLQCEILQGIGNRIVISEDRTHVGQGR